MKWRIVTGSRFQNCPGLWIYRLRSHVGGFVMYPTWCTLSELRSAVGVRKVVVAIYHGACGETLELISSGFTSLKLSTGGYLLTPRRPPRPSTVDRFLGSQISGDLEMIECWEVDCRMVPQSYYDDESSFDGAFAVDPLAELAHYRVEPTLAQLASIADAALAYVGPFDPLCPTTKV